MEKLEECKEEQQITQEETKKNRLSIWRIFAYFILYSILGFVIETIFGMCTKGVIESRKSFLYGPFCAVYGLGASVMVLFLKRFEKEDLSIFLGAIIVGTITEYLVSLFGEVMLQVKWWDYSKWPFNINGRVCLLFSVMWGFLGLFLMKIINPRIDKGIDWLKNKFSPKVGKTIIMAIIIFLVIDWIISTIAVGLFLVRMTHDYDLKVENKEFMNSVYNIIYRHPKLSQFIHKYFGDERLIRNFPDLKINDKEGNIIFFRKLKPEIKAYYFKIFEKQVSEKWES